MLNQGNCEDCRYWSEMLASADAADVSAVCLNQKSRNFKRFTVSRVTCPEWEYGTAVDARTKDDGISLHATAHPIGPRATGDLNPNSIEIIAPMGDKDALL